MMVGSWHLDEFGNQTREINARLGFSIKVWGAVPADLRNVNSRRAVHACLIREAAPSGPPTLSQDPRRVGVCA
jgi:hypothetical protein